jgi:predicted  nucleic acid-binding Zn-ribbon protein
MNKHLKDLIELSNKDIQLDSFEPKLEEIKKELNKSIKQKDKILEQITNAEEEKELTQSNIVKNNLHLQELGDNLDKIQEKTKAVKTDREAKALTLEEELNKEQISFAHEEAERFEKMLASNEEKMEALKKELSEVDDLINQEDKSVQGVISTLESQRDDIAKSKEELLQNMDGKILSYYQKIKRWAGNTTVVPVKKQACYGCFMQINNNVFTDVLKSEEIVNCPSCGRILYYVQEEEA